ncbi:MAG: filamentous hemagglutinin N-terminal domain-containing protein [Cyanobacteria bacterium P01_E01_bin.42]
MKKNWMGELGLLALLGLSSSPALAQIVPDRTLGTENSVIVPVNSQLERIDGGALRGANLFHSFREFNISENHAVYFKNPDVVRTIFSRVTGSNPSELFGTLGVLGDADLIFINPNGIIFGENARLDISGSFVGSTASGVVFPNGEVFSAIAPEVPALVVNVPISITLQFEDDPANIVSLGSLQTGENLHLSGGNLDLQGELVAGENLQLEAEDTVKIRDSGDRAFVAAAGGDLLVEGKEGVDIFVLNHLESGLFSGEDMMIWGQNTLLSGQFVSQRNLTLRATDTLKIRDTEEHRFIAASGQDLLVQGDRFIDILALNHPDAAFWSLGQLSLVSNGTISGDAHFTSGRTFSVTNLSGQPTQLISLYDPIISSVGDVVFGDYIGASLKIESMGSITVGNIINNRPDTALTQGTDPDIEILRSSSALILRAGVKQLSSPLTPENLPISLPTNLPVFTSTTQIYSNNFEGGDLNGWLGLAINVGDLEIDSTPNGHQFLGDFGENDTINLNLRNLPTHNYITVAFDLFIIKSWDGENTIYGPDIWGLSLDTGQTLLLTTFSNETFPSYFSSNPQSYPLPYNSQNPANNTPRSGASQNNYLGYKFGGTGRDSLYSLQYSFPHSQDSLGLNFSSLGLQGMDDESWGLDNVTVQIHNAVGNHLDASNYPIVSSGTVSQGDITARNLRTAGGPIILSATGNINANHSIISEGGNIKIQADGDIVTHAISSSGGSINLNSGGIIDTTRGELNSFAVNNGGNITLIAEGNISTGQITSSGDRGAGHIRLKTNGDILINNVQIRSDAVFSGETGNIDLEANSVFLSNGGRIINGSERGIATGGHITINARDLVEINGFSPGTQDISIVSTGSSSLAPKNSGNLQINTRRLVIKNRGVVTTGTSGIGRGGDLIINASESVELIGADVDLLVPSGLSSDTVGEGNAGDLRVNTRRLIARDGAAISASSFGQGKGGDLIINASESVQLSGTSTNGFSSGVYNQAFADGEAGSLTINTSDLIVQNEAQVTTASRTVDDSNVPIILDPSSFPVPIPTVPDRASGNSGNIDINANSILLNNEGSITAQTDSTGDAGEININSSQLNILGDSQIAAFTDNIGDGGSIKISSSNSIILGGNSQLSVETSSAGKAGNMTLTAPHLIVQETASITATATATATPQEEGGSININSAQIDLAGTMGIFAETQGQVPAGTLTLQPHDNQANLDINFQQGAQISASTSGSGQGGNLRVIAPQTIDISGNGMLAVETRSTGNAGNIEVRSQNLNLSNGAQISASTLGSGRGGNVNLLIENSIQAIGENTGIFASTGSNSIGNGGDINIQTNTLSWGDNATINVNSQGQGTGGDIEVRSRRIDLDNSSISAETLSTQGGDIELTVEDLLMMRNESQISTTAGTARAGGNGGNITINAENGFLVGPPQENNDITANAFEGNGGRIDITAQDIFGLEFRDELTENSDITASSEFGLDGTVNINTLDVDPANGLSDLPEQPAEPQVRQGCSKGGANSSSLHVVGIGGSPDNPDDLLTGEILGEWISLDTEEMSADEPLDELSRGDEDDTSQPLQLACASSF